MDREERLRRQREFLTGFAFWAVWAAAAWLFLKAAGSVLLPFVLAFAAAWLLSFPVDFAADRLHLKRGIAAVVLVLLFYILLACLFYFAGTRLIALVYDTCRGLAEYFSETIVPVLQRLFVWLEEFMSAFYPASANADAAAGVAAAASAGAVSGTAVQSTQALEKAGKLVSGISDGVIDGVSGAAAGIPGILMNILIAVIATVFMELEFHSIKGFLKRQIPEKYLKSLQEGKEYVTGTIGKCVLSYCLIFAMTFLELLLGLFVFGIDGAAVIAFLIAVLDILPVLGTGTVLVPWGLIALAAGNVKTGIGVLVLYIVITVVRNIVEPKLVGRQMGLSPVLMLPCMLLGLKFFGILGLFGVPFAVSFIKTLNDRGIVKLYK